MIEAVRKVILKNLDKDFEEGMQYGMIGYYVPHSIFQMATIATLVNHFHSVRWPRKRTMFRSTS